jgi:hypothetical protein
MESRHFWYLRSASPSVNTHTRHELSIFLTYCTTVDYVKMKPYKCLLSLLLVLLVSGGVVGEKIVPKSDEEVELEPPEEDQVVVLRDGECVYEVPAHC